MRKTPQKTLIRWLSYWASCRDGQRPVNVHEIKEFSDVALARKFCICLRRSHFHPDVASDEDIWQAIQTLRTPKAVA